MKNYTIRLNEDEFLTTVSALNHLGHHFKVLFEESGENKYRELANQAFELAARIDALDTDED